MNKDKELLLTALFESWADEKPLQFIPLQPSGSYREYYRIIGVDKKAIGVFNDNLKENQAFLTFTHHFLDKGINVPHVYASDLDKHIYLLQDLGDATLFSTLAENRMNGAFPENMIPAYKKALKALANIQINAGKGLDYSKCYPRGSFDKQSMLWDLNYFKYYFLRLARIPFDEQLLENDFHTFAEYLLEVEHDYFLYRDFQARNIMIHNEQPYFIDYQGGRKGALQYDLASLLYQAKADMPQNIRDYLTEYYIEEASQLIALDKERFYQFFYGYVLMRLIQVMGAYGFRGFYERKSHFLESIPYVVKNLREILNRISLPIEVPALIDCLDSITDAPRLKLFGKPDPENKSLTVTVNSFSYKSAIPEDPSGNGGGFIFDCRALHNPGRYEPYKKLTGRDRDVIDFLKKRSSVETFMTRVYGMVDDSVEKYLSRGFTNLMVSFGCTGGQHRSVYCADTLAAYLERKYNVNVCLNHIEQEKKNWVN